MIFLKFSRLYIFVILLMINILYSCNVSTKPERRLELTEQANSFMNRSIKFAPLFSDSRNSLKPILWNKKNKIILYIDSLYCTSCTFNEIRKWNKYYKELEQMNTEIVIICNHSEVNDVLDIREIAHINYPIFFDVNKRFKLANCIPKDAIFQTFVLGSNNQVIWVGLPIRSEESWERFCLMMTMYNEVSK